MSDEIKIQRELTEKFGYLKDAVTIQRERRMIAEVPTADFAEVFDYLVKKMGFSGLSAITGMDEVTAFAVIYHLTKEGSIMLNLRIRVSRENPSIKTVTQYFPAADAYERELADLLGIKVDGLTISHHYPLPDGWPEGQHPLRKDWKADTAEANMHDAGDVQVPIGPQHPSLKEPESFLLTLRGEKITSVDVILGYNHRGIEKACEERTYIQDLYLIERICGICSHSHSTAFVHAVEEIAGLDIPKRAKYIRTLVGELERVHSHLLWLGVAGHEVGFDTLLMYTWRDREIVMDLLATLTGNRVNYGINTIGGVRRDVTPEQAEEALKAMEKLEESANYFIELASKEITLIKRLSGVGVVSNEDAVRLGAVGPTGRASGIQRDVRRDDPYAAYGEMDFDVIVDNHNDVYGRTLVRVKELKESFKIIRQILKNMPDGPISVKAPRKIPAGEAVSRYEAPRGEDMHYVRANGTDKPDRVKVRPPTLANIQVVAHMLKDRYLADMPIVIAAIDPCFSCTDRMISINNLDTKKKETVIWNKIRLMGIEHYKKQGIDFTELNKKFFRG